MSVLLLLTLCSFSKDGYVDTVSHYLLRLVFRKPDRREWFVHLESLLYEIRLRNSSNDSLGKEWCKIHNYKPLTKAELEQDTQLLAYLRRDNVEADPNTLKVYKIEFEKALSLIKKRKVFLRGGFVYMVISSYMDSVREFFVGQFKTRLRIELESLDTAYKNDDERVKSLLDAIPNVVIQYEYHSHHIDIHTLDDLAVKHFPLCMKYMHQQLTKKRHLKHDARLRYSLFLKGIGVQLEDALQFWQQRMDPTSYKKNSMTYNIRYNYGKERGLKDYSPFACKTIINTPAQSDSDHGCPFKCKSKNQLINLFNEANIHDQGQQEIISLYESQQYNEACKAYYKYTHNNQVFDDDQNHPNKYFDISFGRKRGAENKNNTST